jgi:glycosyltransferase involved in cell wall biosynthesis
MLKIIYRICDQRNGVTKIPQVSKRQCFLNFIEVFGTDDMIIVADNCSNETIEFLNCFTTCVEKTSLGNSGSFLYAMDLALQYKGDQSVYLVEDDYLHQPDSSRFLMEGLQRADYVSLYDHADKYSVQSPNPMVSNGGENTKVILTPSSHWKYTNSTTMTFATRSGILKADQEIFRKFCANPVPADFFIFRTLAERGRTLATPIPGRSTHCDGYPSPFIFNSPFPFKPESGLRQGIAHARETCENPIALESDRKLG